MEKNFSKHFWITHAFEVGRIHEYTFRSLCFYTRVISICSVPKGKHPKW